VETPPFPLKGLLRGPTYRGVGGKKMEKEKILKKIYFYWELPKGLTNCGKITVPMDEKGVFTGYYQSIPEALTAYFASRGHELLQINELKREGHNEHYTEYWYEATVVVDS
jgi:hypothetical protein